MSPQLQSNEMDVVRAAIYERSVSAHPNWVTARGLKQIHDNVMELQQAREQALQADDLATVQHIESDLRYWQRRAQTAVLTLAATTDQVGFGSRVQLRFTDGRERCYTVVGEDEAQSAKQYLSWTSELGKLLLNRRIGDSLLIRGEAAEVMAIESVDA